ncbi:MAG: hypothetical protein DSY32_01215 [Aquifex sp.]|nr:MAG: hypothetical protein DSY32_01215 [Aquifex sp.]
MKEEPKNLSEWLKKLKEASKEAVILVEGKNDKKALLKFSIKNVFIYFTENYPVLEDKEIKKFALSNSCIV